MSRSRQSPIWPQVIIKFTLDTDLSLESHLYTLACKKLNASKGYDKVCNDAYDNVPALEEFCRVGCSADG